ncbi:hypothetical protein JCM8547_003551 [Rhodosporidiobolus lusitaniae]
MSTDAATTAAAQQAALMAAIQQALDRVLAPIVAASFVSCALCGVVLSLVVTYFSRFPNDLWQYKLLVTFMTVCALVDTAVTSSWVYDFSVKYFAQPQMLAYWPWQLTAYAFVTGPTILAAQLFFTWRVWVVSGRKAYLLVGALLLIVVGAVGCCLYMGVWASNAVMLTEFTGIAGACWAWLGAELAADFGITLGMVWYLLIKPRRELGSSSHIESSPLMRIVYHAFATNGVAALLQLAVVITIGISLNRGSLEYTVAGFQESKVYIASVLAVLNARRQTDSGGALSSSHGASDSRSKGFGAAGLRRGSTSTAGALFSTSGRAQQANSVHVHVEHQVEEERGEVYGGAGEGFSPYAVNFSSSGGGRGGEKEDERSVEEKGGRFGY